MRQHHIILHVSHRKPEEPCGCGQYHHDDWWGSGEMLKHLFRLETQVAALTAENARLTIEVAEVQIKEAQARTRELQSIERENHVNQLLYETKARTS
jgi:hypothetical protein